MMAMPIFAAILLFALPPCEVQESRVRKLIHQLTDDDVEQREAAARQLIELGEPIIPQLIEARDSVELEAKARIDGILHNLRWYEHTAWTGVCAVNIESGIVLWEAPPAQKKTLRTYLSMEYQHLSPDGKVLFLGDPEGRLECRSLKDGKILWETAPLDKEDRLGRWKRPYACTFTLFEEIPVRFSAKRMIAHDPATGKELWSEPAGSIDKGPYYQSFHEMPGSRFLVVSKKGKGARCHDLKTGKMLWELDDAIVAAAALPEGDVILHHQDWIGRHLGTNGSPQWRIAKDPSCGNVRCRSYGSFILTKGFMGKGHGLVGCLDSRTGKIVYSMGGECFSASCLSGDGKVLFVATVGSLAAVNTTTWETKWTHALTTEDDSPSIMIGVDLLVNKDRLHIAQYELISCRIGLRCLDASTGKLAWEADAKGIQVDHSKYSHRAHLLKKGAHIVIVGHASAGEYMEAFRMQNGACASRWAFRRW